MRFSIKHLCELATRIYFPLMYWRSHCRLDNVTETSQSIDNLADLRLRAKSIHLST
jgi:hypothetical protein